MGLIIWVIFGGLVGWIASMLMKTNEEQGILLNIVVGITGAIIGGWIMAFIGQSGITGFNINSFVVALLGAVLFIGIVKLFRGRA